MKSLRTWLNFDWTDFQHLQKLKKTFKVRHLPLSNETAWIGTRLVKSPKSWGSKPPVRSQKKADRPKVSSTACVPDYTPVITIWDSDEDGLAGVPKTQTTSPAQKKKKRKLRKVRTPSPQKKSRHAASGKDDDRDVANDDETGEEGSDGHDGDDDQEKKDGGQNDDSSSWETDDSELF